MDQIQARIQEAQQERLRLKELWDSKQAEERELLAQYQQLDEERVRPILSSSLPLDLAPDLLTRRRYAERAPGPEARVGEGAPAVAEGLIEAR